MARWRRFNGLMAGWLNGSVTGLLMLLLCGSVAHGQINKFILEGNKAYEKQNYKQASIDYAKALQKDPNNVPGIFNLGNSLYQQKQYDLSRRVMESAAKVAPTKEGKAQANYNIGNTYMSQRKWDEAISAYKQTLRNNPQDADAKYNLSYASAMKKKEEQQQKQDKDKKDQQKQDQQKQDDKKDDKKDKKDQDQNKDGDKKEEQKKDQQQPQPDPSKMSEQAAEQQLNALRQQENKLQDKMKKEKGVPVRMQKDW